MLVSTVAQNLNLLKSLSPPLRIPWVFLDFIQELDHRIDPISEFRYEVNVS